MTPRIIVAMMASVCAASILPTGETIARSGGMAPGSLMHAPAPLPQAARAPFSQRTVPGHATPWGRHRLHGGRFIPGYAWPLAAGWLGAPMSEYDGGTDAYPDAPYRSYAPPVPVASPPPPAPTPVVQSVTRIIVIRGGCESTPETVNWRDGSQRTITMVRC
jgi:hypothetical protein